MRSHEVNHLMQLNFEFCTRYNEEIDIMNESPFTICDPDGEPIEYELKHIDLASDWDLNLEMELPDDLIELKDCIKEGMEKGLEKVAQIAFGNRTLLEVIEQKNKQIESLQIDLRALQAQLIRELKFNDEERHEPYCDVETSRTVGSDTESQWLALWSR